MAGTLRVRVSDTLALGPRQVLAGLMLAAALWLPAVAARACGPFRSQAVFTFVMHPDMPLQPFAAGQLGILQPGYARSYLVVAYRHLTGTPLDAAEQQAALALWSRRLNPMLPAPAEDSAATDAWRAARGLLADAPAVTELAVFREVPGASYYLVFANCLPDAYRTAAATLRERARKVGSDSLRVRDWLSAQDAVFGHCGDTSTIPEPLPATADQGERADRAYQIAAAQFYAGRFDAALAAFRQIALDPASSWRTIAPYLQARTLVRKGTLGAPEGEIDRAVLLDADRQIAAVLADPAQAALHAAAVRLRGFVRFRTEPTLMRAELASALLQPAQGAALQQRLTDYTLLLDRLTGEFIGPAQRPPEPNHGREALTRWVLLFQSDGADAAEQAVAAWHAERSLPSLLAALAKVSERDSAVPELLQAVERLEAQSPGWATAGYHGARLLSARGEREAARARLEALLASPPGTLPPGAVNQLLALRLPLAASLDAFARDLPRVPVATAYDAAEMPEDVDGDPVSVRRTTPLPSMLDDAGAALVDATTPIGLRAPLIERTPGDGVRRALAVAGWVRAVIASDAAAADTLAPLAAADPALAPALAEWRAAAAQDRAYVALLLLLRTPGLSPFVRAGLPRETAPAENDPFRDNWWCAVGDGDDEQAADDPVPPAFLSAEQRQAAGAQWQALRVLPTGPNYLARETLAWAEARPADPRLPEALHLAVRATRFGCTDEATSGLSKRAFQLLHRRFPQNPWTEKTKYHF